MIIINSLHRLIQRERSLPMVWIFCLTLAGCGDVEQIHSYKAPKELPSGVADRPATDRMLAAIIPQADKAWFFKLTGPLDEVAALEERFNTFIQSIELPADAAGLPRWELPEGWKALPGSGLRAATIEIPSDEKPLELTVSTLGWDASDEQAGLLSNINRWRGQLGLPPIGEHQIESHTREIKLANATAVLVNLEGRAAPGGPGGMAAPPFAAGMPATAGSPPAADSPRSTAKNDLPKSETPGLRYTVPSGWAKGATNQFRKAAFIVVDGNKKVEITVSTAGGDLLANVNRWRGQVKLPVQTLEQLSATLKKIPVGPSSGDYVELEGPEGQTILGIAATINGEQWFIKLTGDSELAAREKERFEEFVKSLRFGA